MGRYSWFKVHLDIIDDPKMFPLTKAQRFDWVCLIGIAKDFDQGGLIPLFDDMIAWRLRMTGAEATDLISKLESVGFVKRTEHGVQLINFIKRQYDKPSDEPSKTRDRKRKQRVTPMSRATKGVTSRGCHDTETETETEEETDTETASASHSSASPTSRVSAQSVFDAWNEIGPPAGLASVRELTDDRRDKIKTRSKAGRDLAWWRSLFQRIVATPFLCGESERGWKANLDWAIASERNVAKILEGAYDASARAGPTKKPPAPRQSLLNLIEIAKAGRDDPNASVRNSPDAESRLPALGQGPRRDDGRGT